MKREKRLKLILLAAGGVFTVLATLRLVRYMPYFFGTLAATIIGEVVVNKVFKV